MQGIIVIADTHFGIKKGSINMSMPGYFADFLDWVRTLDENPVTVNVVDGPLRKKTIKEKTIYPPNKIIFLGDLIELWDSEKEPVTACVSTIIPTLSGIRAEKIYVLGNHDNTLRKIVLEKPHKGYMNYRLGRSVLKVFPDMYPLPSEDTIVTEKCGIEEYVFVHGHQFDKYFTKTRGSYELLGIIRNASDNLTIYIPLLFVAGVIVKMVNWIAHTSIFLGESPTFWLLFLLTLPRIYMDIGRRFWNWIVGMRYKKQETITRFTYWWEKCVKRKKVPEHVNVVYGHTHFLNYIPSPNHEPVYKELGRTLHRHYKEKLTQKNIPEENMPSLINISAWVTDFFIFSEKFLLSIEKASGYVKQLVVKEKKERLDPELTTVATFLHIDEDGFEFFGWNWYSDEPEQKIFHIPKAAIVTRRERGPVTDDETVRAVLEEVGWPRSVLELWAKDPHI